MPISEDYEPNNLASQAITIFNSRHFSHRSLRHKANLVSEIGDKRCASATRRPQLNKAR